LKFHKELELLGYIKISQIDDTLVYDTKPYIKKIIKVSYGPKGNIHTFQIYFELKRVPNFCIFKQALHCYFSRNFKSWFDLYFGFVINPNKLKSGERRLNKQMGQPKSAG
jgi:hypothetical protein